MSEFDWVEVQERIERDRGNARYAMGKLILMFPAPSPEQSFRSHASPWPKGVVHHVAKPWQVFEEPETRHPLTYDELLNKLVDVTKERDTIAGVLAQLQSANQQLQEVHKQYEEELIDLALLKNQNKTLENEKHDLIERVGSVSRDLVRDRTLINQGARNGQRADRLSRKLYRILKIAKGALDEKSR